MALLFSGFGIYAVFAIGGVTDVLFMPLSTLAAYRWDRFGAGRRTYAGPVLLGLAMGIEQTVWPVLPFLLIALWLEQRGRTRPAAGSHGPAATSPRCWWRRGPEPPVPPRLAPRLDRWGADAA